MENIAQLRENLSIFSKDFNRASAIYRPDSPEAYVCIADYIEFLEKIPEISAFLKAEKLDWDVSDDKKHLPNIWSSLDLLYPIYLFYKRGVGVKPKYTHYVHDEFFTLHAKVLRLLMMKELPGKKVMHMPIFSFKNDLVEINGYTIRISLRHEQTKALQLIKHIFSNEDPYQKFSFYSIQEEVFGELGGGSRRSAHTAAESLQDKIAKGTNGTITDFFIVGSGKNGFIQINPKYNPQIT